MMKGKMGQTAGNTIWKNTFFRKTFFMLSGIMTLFLLIFAVYTYRNSRNIIEREFIASSKYSTQVLADSTDNQMLDMRYILATLDSNDLVKIYFVSDKPGDVVSGFYARLQDYLKAYVQGYASIDSIYLYSEKKSNIITATQNTPLAYFTDKNWLEHMEDNPQVYSVFPRAKNNSFPFLVTLMKQIPSKDGENVILINIDLSKEANLLQIHNSKYQEAFLLSDDGRILYRHNQRDVSEPLSVNSYLEHFDRTVTEKSILVSGESPYTYTQIHSASYPWSYVQITHLAEYTYKLSDSRALLLTLVGLFIFISVCIAVFFSLRSARPIQDILLFLDNPSTALTEKKVSEKEIRYIASRIVSYAQTNKELSQELNTRLSLLNETKLLALQSQINPHFLFNTLNMINLLEIEALGYNHIVPKMSLNLSKLLRYAIDSIELVTLETELTYTDIYLSILNKRYGDKLQVIKEIAAEAYPIKVPKLFIQPIIENAVFHGLSKNLHENSYLRISCQVADNLCTVKIQDNGIGMTEEVLLKLRNDVKETTNPMGSIGLKNVAVRMALLYGENFSIEIDSKEGEGSTFTLSFSLL